MELKDEIVWLFETLSSSSRIIIWFFKPPKALWRQRMIHIQKSLSFILLNRAIYHDRPFSIMWWLRKCVWIQRMLRPHALQYWEVNLSFERINLSSEVPITDFIMNSTYCFLDLSIPLIDEYLFWIKTQEEMSLFYQWYLY